MVEHTPSNNNLTKKVKALYTENYKMLMKVIEDTDKKIFCLWIGRINAELSFIANLYIENLINEFSHLQTDISIDKNNFFPFWMAYVFLTLLLWLELWVLYWGKNERGTSYLVPDPEGETFNLLLLRMITIGLLYMAFIMSMYIPTISSFFTIFVKEGCHPLPGWPSQMLFLHLLRWFYTSFC